MKPPRSGGFIFIHNKKLERLSSGKREKGLVLNVLYSSETHFFSKNSSLAENTESSFNVIRNYFFNGFVFCSKSGSFSFELR